MARGPTVHVDPGSFVDDCIALAQDFDTRREAHFCCRRFSWPFLKSLRLPLTASPPLPLPGPS